MSLWSTLTQHAKAQFLDVIQWLDDTPNTLVYRFPVFQQAIQDGGKLVVREGQAAVFVAEGRLSDVFGPGTYEISTKNTPIASFFSSIKYALNYPYKGDIYFISTRQFTDQKWGTANPIPMRDADLGVVRIRAFGAFAFRITDPAVFMREIVGTAGLFTTEEITGQLRRKLVSALADTIGESKIPVLDLVAQYMDLGDALRQRLTGWFQANYGITLTDFVVENVSVPPEVEKMMDTHARMKLAGNQQDYLAFQAAENIGGAMRQGGGGGGNAMMDAGIGLAMGQALGARLGQAMNPAAPAAAPAMPPPLPPAMVFHYAGPDNVPQNLGPADIAARVRANPAGRHLAWREGMAGWTNAADVPEVRAHLGALPPPLPPG
ncbi:MAG: SPFH domain-containing protein [Deltaproteobacteria bacterium]|nr:SPFH domain-containing protein [Deltaproteobacteria bacterium]